jgi:predicted DNA-binding transcriptional regulator AlpA
MEKNGLLPPRRKISTRAVGWLLADIESFIKQLGVTD